MDAAERAICTDDVNPLVAITIQGCGMLTISHLFHLILKPLGQPGPIAQILAGVVLGPSVLCRIKKVRAVFVQPDLEDYTVTFSFLFRLFFIFLIGLETDIPYLRRNLGKASIISSGGALVCGIFGAAISYFVIRALKINENQVLFALAFILILATSAPPVVIRLVAELKFDTADIGRLAIASSLVNETTCLLCHAVFVAFARKDHMGKAVLSLFLTILAIILNRLLVVWYNRRNQNQAYMVNAGIMTTLIGLIIGFSFIIEYIGFSSTISCYLLGLTFPREGKMTRTLSSRLAYAVNNFVVPVYFGFTGFGFDVDALRDKDHKNLVVVLLVLLLSTGGKIIGTLAACDYLKIPRNEGVILAFLLNLKGHAEVLFIQFVPLTNDKWFNENVRKLVVLVVVLETVISGPVVTFILRREEKHFAHNHTDLEFHDPQSEIRLLFCVYDSRHMSSKLGLISAMRGSFEAPIIPYLMQLVELPKKSRKTKLMYHELQNGDQFSDEEDYGGNEVLEINDAVDAFTAECRFLIRQMKVVSSFANMYEDICNTAEDMRVSIIFLSFHKHQRLDGILESGKEGVRMTNQRVLRHAPCSVGIFVDRGQTGFGQPRSDLKQNVATLFFGGPDDREALACSRRIASHLHVNLTVIRFLVASTREEHDSSNENGEVLVSPASSGLKNAIDSVFVEEFCNRYVAYGKAGYMEKYVNNGKETLQVLREIGDQYSLFIVGKGGRDFSPMTTDISDWEECPELGTVGDLLASSELRVKGSVLVIQQHRQSRNHQSAMGD